MFVFKLKYLLWAVAIFLIEVVIALFVHDKIIRPYIGDVLVVILIYCFVRAFINIRVSPAAIGVLIFSFFVEGLQYVHIIEKLGLENNKVARVVIGTSFSVEDLLAYLVGIILVVITENIFRKKDT
ncbi:MAG: DUF2809 domain-containing protein [Pseudopedobacter saltans]|uniref:DUF2809 domain-containing protein n=1 Tax=Pseudopedobacter saltans TaxID=151895 RepID=A0A2W5ETJ3_9SPHI|nr:MAG: DUF2809 domain-containing protein [Pseudopedobacter saltans]